MSYYGYYNPGSYPNYHPGQNWTQQGPPPSAPPTTGGVIQFGSFPPAQMEQSGYPQTMYMAPPVYPPYPVPMMHPQSYAYSHHAHHHAQMSHPSGHGGGGPPGPRDGRVGRKHEGRGRSGQSIQHRDHGNRETMTHGKSQMTDEHQHPSMHQHRRETNAQTNQHQQHQQQHQQQQSQHHQQQQQQSQQPPPSQSQQSGHREATTPMSTTGYVAANVPPPPSQMSAQMMHPHHSYHQMPYYHYPAAYGHPGPYNMSHLDASQMEAVNAAQGGYPPHKSSARLQLEPGSMPRSNVATPTPSLSNQEANDPLSPKSATQSTKKRLPFLDPTTKIPIDNWPTSDPATNAPSHRAMMSNPSSRPSSPGNSPKVHVVDKIMSEISTARQEATGTRPERTTSSKVVSKVQKTELKTGDAMKKPGTGASMHAHNSKKIIDPSNGTYQPGSSKNENSKILRESDGSFASSAGTVTTTAKLSDATDFGTMVLNTVESIERRVEEDSNKEEKIVEKKEEISTPALEKDTEEEEMERGEETEEESQRPQVTSRTKLIFDRQNVGGRKMDNARLYPGDRRAENVAKVIVGSRLIASENKTQIEEQKKQEIKEVFKEDKKQDQDQHQKQDQDQHQKQDQDQHQKQEIVQQQDKNEMTKTEDSEFVSCPVPPVGKQTESPKSEEKESTEYQSLTTPISVPAPLTVTPLELKRTESLELDQKSSKDLPTPTSTIYTSESVAEKSKEDAIEGPDSGPWITVSNTSGGGATGSQETETNSPLKEQAPRRTSSGKVLLRSSSSHLISRKNSASSIRGTRSMKMDPMDVFHVSSEKRKYSFKFLKNCREDFTEKPNSIENLACMTDFDGAGLKTSRSGSDKWPKQSLGRGGYDDRSGKASLNRIGSGKDWMKNSDRSGGNTVLVSRRLTRQVSGQRGPAEDGKWGKSDLSLTSPFAPNSGSGVGLHKSENKYVIGSYQTDDPEEEKRQRTFKGLLNKLTPDNFDKMLEQFKEVEIPSDKTLRGLIDQIFDKALIESTFCPLYSDLCKVLTAVMPEFEEEDGKRKITFRRLLLNKCQAEYEKGDAAARAEAKAKAEDETISKEERMERLAQAKKERFRSLGNMQFIGFLFKKGMLIERIIHNCIKDLLREDENPKAEDVECLCKLVSTVGELLPADKQLEAYFSRISGLSKNKKLDTRLRFMLIDLIELKDRHWVERREKEGPKTIEEIHRNALAEQQAQNARNRGSYNDRRDGGMGGGSGSSSFMNRTNRSGGGGSWNRPSNMNSGNSADRNPRAPSTYTTSHEEVKPLTRNLSLQRTDSLDISLRPSNMESKGSRPAVVSMPRPRSKSPTEQKAARNQPAPIVETEEAPPSPALEGAELDRKVKALLTEYYMVKDLEEVLKCINELSESNALKSDSLKSILLTALDIRGVDVEQRLVPIIPIIQALLERNLFERNEVKQGLKATMAALPEIAEDFPKAPVLIAKMLGSLASNNTIPLKAILDPVRGIILGAGKDEKSEEDTPLVDSNNASQILIELLKQMKTEEREGEKTVKELLAQEKVDFALFYPSYVRDDVDLSDELQFLES